MYIGIPIICIGAVRAKIIVLLPVTIAAVSKQLMLSWWPVYIVNELHWYSELETLLLVSMQYNKCTTQTEFNYY